MYVSIRQGKGRENELTVRPRKTLVGTVDVLINKKKIIYNCLREHGTNLRVALLAMRAILFNQ